MLKIVKTPIGTAPEELCWTEREIAQQADMLRATHCLLQSHADRIAAFLDPLLAQDDLRIILTGAGTSAFIGECLSRWLSSNMRKRVEAIPTTDIVSSPSLYLEPSVPTLLVSFGRSGNSPESIAAVKIADQVVDDVHHLIITCNANGQLATDSGENSLVFLLPEATHDRSFAMTSSFSCMTYAALAILGTIELMDQHIDAIATSVQASWKLAGSATPRVAKLPLERAVFLGSGPFSGLAREAALKTMELTNGQVATAFDSPLGFRHGPKVIVNTNTLVVIFLSNDAYTRQYDLDLLQELRRDGNALRVIAISATPGVEDALLVPDMEAADDVHLLFPYIVAPQLLALALSRHLGFNPDNPNTAGTVNRVVKGVHIYPLAR